MAAFGEIIVAIASFVWVSPSPVSIRHWGILPLFRQVPKQEVGAFLEALPKPALVGVMAEPGHIIALPLSELDRAAQAAVTTHLRNQREYFREKYASFPAMLRTGTVRIRLSELDELVSLDEMDRLLSEYLVPAPWTLQADDDDGQIQFIVRGANMVWSAGRSGKKSDPA